MGARPKPELIEEVGKMRRELVLVTVGKDGLIQRSPV